MAEVEMPGVFSETQGGGKGYWTWNARKGHVTVEPPYQSEFYGTQNKWTVSAWTKDCNYIWRPLLVDSRTVAADLAKHMHALLDHKITLKELRKLDPTEGWNGSAQPVTFPVWLA